MQKLSKAASDAKKAYFKEWRKNNRDKTKAYVQRYWEKKASDPEGEAMTTEAKSKALKQAGKTQREIAKELNISLGTVNKLLKTD